MGLFGEKCARCGKKRTREQYEGQPTCEICRDLLEKKLEAGKEAVVVCPIDGERLAKEIVASKLNLTANWGCYSRQRGATRLPFCRLITH